MFEVKVTGVFELGRQFGIAAETINPILLRELERLALIGQSKTVGEKLQGFPLHHRTGNLQRAVIASAGVKDEGSSLVGFWGVTRLAPYGEVHEKGGLFIIPEHRSTSRTGKEFTVRTHSALFPKRAFLEPVLREMEPTIQERLTMVSLRVVANALHGGGEEWMERI